MSFKYLPTCRINAGALGQFDGRIFYKLLASVIERRTSFAKSSQAASVRRQSNLPFSDNQKYRFFGWAKRPADPSKVPRGRSVGSYFTVREIFPSLTLLSCRILERRIFC